MDHMQEKTWMSQPFVLSLGGSVVLDRWLFPTVWLSVQWLGAEDVADSEFAPE